MQKPHVFSIKHFLLLTLLCFQASIIFQSCQKSFDNLEKGQVAGRKGGNGGGNGGGNPHNPPPPPPPSFFFWDCYYPSINSASFPVGIPANKQITKNYSGSPGGSYPAFTSATVNGITFTAPAGTFNVGSGSIVFTATGTPLSVGHNSVSLAVGNIQPCSMHFTVINAPVSGPNADPGPTFGSTGIVNFTYKGQAVAYKTVRAKDGKIWLQQNLGSPQVAFHNQDEASFGDYFQWGRWDDGHQVANSPTISGGPSLLNPSNIPSGNPNFIVGTTEGTRWWGTGGLSTDTWSGSTAATSTSGKDPCVALGPGWRLPTAADWQSVKTVEDLEGTLAAFMSNLKLPTAGRRDHGFVYSNGESNYWSGSATGIHATEIFISNDTYSATLQAAYRGQGNNCRCVKD